MPRPRAKKPKPRAHERDWHAGSVRQLPSGRYQGVRARDTSGKRLTRAFATRQQAEVWAAGARTTDILTLGAWLDRWLDLRWPTLRISSQDAYRRAVVACAPLAGRPLTDLTTDDWQRLTNALLTKWARSHVVLWRQAVGAALNYAVRQRIIDRNPLRDVVLPRATDAPVRAWTREQVERLLIAARDDPHEVWFLVALGTGIRLGEARALVWDDVDFRARTLSITKSRHYTKAVLGPTKSGKHRTVDLPDELVPVLTAHHARQQPSARLVFGTGDDQPHASSTYNAAVTRICKRAGVVRLSPHALRHSFTTLALDDNVPIQDIAHALGHASIAMTMHVYSHFIGQGQRRAAKSLGSLFAPSIRSIGAQDGVG